MLFLLIPIIALMLSFKAKVYLIEKEDEFSKVPIREFIPTTEAVGVSSVEMDFEKWTVALKNVSQSSDYNTPAKPKGERQLSTKKIAENKGHYKNTCQCAKVSEHLDIQPTMRKQLDMDESDHDSQDYIDYIVGGRIVFNSRPWMALIVSSSKPSKILYPEMRCGGALINKRYVLTASHCVCNGKNKTKKTPLTCQEGGINSGKLKYNPKNHLWVILGINNKDKGLLTYEGTDHLYGVEKVVENPKFRWDYFPEDIALIKLDRDAGFKKNHIMPICLPLKDDGKDIKIAKLSVLKNRVYSSGWGKVLEKCTTDTDGPIKHMKCKLNKKYGKVNCIKTPPPHSKDGLCAKFKKVEPNKYPRKKKSTIRVIDRQEREAEICYANVTGPMGWCNSNMNKIKYKNWGWCNPSVCNEESSMQNRLKEVRMMLIPIEDCKHIINWNNKYRKNNNDFFDEATELCVGTKRNFTRTVTYIKSTNKNTGEIEYIDKIRNKIFSTTIRGEFTSKNYYLNYYLGGGDTCAGDSGGPLYTWIKGVPILIGLVSRGGGYGPTEKLSVGCGELNYPGIYTRVSKYLDWIRKNSKNGEC